LLLALVCAVCLVCLGCVRSSPLPTPADPDEASLAWARFTRYCAEREQADGPFLIQGSLRHQDGGGGGNRLHIVLWGNDRRHVRLDVTAGPGMMIGRISLEDNHLLIHAPQEKKAWAHQGRAGVLLAPGLPAPLGIADIVDFVQGRFLAVLDTPERTLRGVDPFLAPEETGTDIAYRLEDGALPGSVALTPEGLLALWRQAPGQWAARVAYGADRLPAELELVHPDGRRLVFSIDSRQTPAAFTAEQLRLSLPADTVVENMRRARNRN
jgi:hypothetical protein